MWKVAKAFKVSIKWENGSRPTIQVNRKPSLHTFLLSLSVPEFAYKVQVQYNYGIMCVTFSLFFSGRINVIYFL